MFLQADWPFYLALSLFCSILAGVAARAAQGNASSRIAGQVGFTAATCRTRDGKKTPALRACGMCGFESIALLWRGRQKATTSCVTVT